MASSKKRDLPSDDRRFLVIGGTQFMGRHMVETLLALPGAPKVIMINRGKTAVPHSIQRAISAGIVEHWHCDRLGDRSKFRALLAAGGHFDAIIDFVAFGPNAISDVARAASVGHYIFISSDSIYMACPCALNPTGERISEAASEADCTDAQRRALKRSNSYQFGYGGNKLKCERRLQELARRQPEFRYTALRLPDVIGPYDNLCGILELQTKILEDASIGLEVEGGCNEHRLSFVFAPDVAAAALAALGIEQVVNKEINVACTECPTVDELVQMVAQSLQMEAHTDPSAEFDFCSVTFGPVDNRQALEWLDGWQPTPLAEAIRRTVEWNSCPANAQYSRTLAISSESESDSESFESSSSDAEEVPRNRRMATERSQTQGAAAETFKFDFKEPEADQA